MASAAASNKSGAAPTVNSGASLTLGARFWTCAALLTLGFSALFFRWLRTQADHSAHELEDWGHAFVVPLISAYLIWQRRHLILREPVGVFWPGILPLVLGVVCYFFFLVGVPNHMLQGFSLVLTLAGTALFITGPRVFHHLFVPIAFLLFAITISKQIMEKVTFPLQLLASKGAYFILKLISLPGDWYFVDVKGNVLEIRFRGVAIPLNVAEACSGMRMVIAFIALGAAVAIFSCRHWWQRIALLLLAVPVALLMNTIRVAVLGLVSLVDPKLASGDAHMLIGTILLVPGLFLFLGVVWALNKMVTDAPEVGRAA